MKKMNIAFIFVMIMSVFCTSSCSPKPPYEIKSPCVSFESKDPWVRSPCSRVPLNRDIA